LLTNTNYVFGRAGLRDNFVLSATQASMFVPGPNAGATLPVGTFSLLVSGGNLATYTVIVARGNSAQSANLQEWQKSDGTVYAAVDAVGRVGIGQATPSALLHFKAGTSAATTAPLKFTSGTLLGTPEAGAVEFLTDDFYATITAGAARKSFVLTDGTNLTSGRIPAATTNGRLIDGPAPVVDGTYNVDGSAAGTVATITVTKGLITGITTR
jgi:hypothetical protein